MEVLKADNLHEWGNVFKALNPCLPFQNLRQLGVYSGFRTYYYHCVFLVPLVQPIYVSLALLKGILLFYLIVSLIS